MGVRAKIRGFQDSFPLSPLKVLKEKYIPQGQIGYAAYERLDVKLIVKEAVKLMKMA